MNGYDFTRQHINVDDDTYGSVLLELSSSSLFDQVWLISFRYVDNKLLLFIFLVSH